MDQLLFRAGSDPTSLWFLFCFGFVVFWCFLFVCLLCCLFWFDFDGTAHWTVYWSISSAFEAIDV